MTRPSRWIEVRLLPGLVLLAALAANFTHADEPPKPQAPPQTAAQREQLKQRDRFGGQAQRFVAEGKLDQAVKAAEAMLKIERDVLGPDNDDALGSLDLIAQIQLAREDWAAARSARREALDRLTARLGKDHWRSHRCTGRRWATWTRSPSWPSTSADELEDSRRLDSQAFAAYQQGQSARPRTWPGRRSPSAARCWASVIPSRSTASRTWRSCSGHRTI